MKPGKKWHAKLNIGEKENETFTWIDISALKKCYKFSSLDERKAKQLYDSLLHLLNKRE